MSYLANIFTRKAKSRFITASIFGSFCFLYPFNKIHKNHDQPPTNNHNSNDINHYNIHYPQNK